MIVNYRCLALLRNRAAPGGCERRSMSAKGEQLRFVKTKILGVAWTQEDEDLVPLIE